MADYGGANAECGFRLMVVRVTVFAVSKLEAAHWDELQYHPQTSLEVSV